MSNSGSSKRVYYETDKQCHPTINISPYIPKFVRSLHQKHDCLIKTPFIFNQFGAVLMVDIVGFSQMTSIASSKGDVGAEMLASQIDSYFDLAIRIIESHGGDVVKFLGDALLVVFQPDLDLDMANFSKNPQSPLLTDEDPAIVLKRHQLLVGKAVECGLELLAQLSNYRIYLSEREFARKLSGATVLDDVSIGNNTMAEGMLIAPGLQSRGARGTGGAGQSGIGPITSPQFSMRVNGEADVFWNDVCTDPNAMSASYCAWPSPPLNNSHSTTSNASTITDSSRTIANITTNTALTHKASISSLAIFDKPPNQDPASQAPSRRASIANTTPELPSSKLGNRSPRVSISGQGDSGVGLGPGGVAGFRKREGSVNSTHSRRSSTSSSKTNRAGTFLANAKQLFNHAPQSDRQDMAPDESSDDAHNLQLHMALSAANIVIGDAGNDNDLDNLLVQETGRLEYAVCSANMATIEDALSMARAGEVTITKNAWKYVNADAYPWSEPRRNCYILKNIQEPLTNALLPRVRNDKIVSASIEGFIQQFAVDDKGATLLCAFGLPYPRSHETEALFAAKTAWVIRTRFLENDIHGFKISLATGVIFTSTIGNEFRRDPAIEGDTIVIAVRILKLDHAMDSVVCDEATMMACSSDHSGLCVFEDRGVEYVKGKIRPLRIFRLIHFGAKKQTRRPFDATVDETIGYGPERDKVVQFIDAWSKHPDKNTILVSGPQGSGKRMFYQQIVHIADSSGYQICSAASVEVEKNTEYYPCKFLLLGIFDIMRKADIPFTGRSHQVVPKMIPLPEAFDPDHENPATNADGDDDDEGRLALAPSVRSYTEGYRSSPFPPMSPIAEDSNDLTPHTSGTQGEVHSSQGRRRSSTFSADMAVSPTISQYEEPSARTSTNMTKLEAFINICLCKMGQSDCSLIPALHDIIANISSDNSQHLANHHDDKIFTDFIVDVLNYASKFLKVIIMLEDIQWCDSKSLEVIFSIHDRCPAVLVVLFSRPLRDYGGNTLRWITNERDHLDISLEGLKRREIEQALLRAFKPNGVTSISPEVIELVQDRTKGNPKFVKNMANMLKEFCHVNIVDGELLTTGHDSNVTEASVKNIEEMLVKQDRKKTTLMQYDRLGPKFQEFLKIASCLGERFSLAEVAAIRPIESLLGVPDPGRTYAQLISDQDMYKFLNMATEQQTNIQFSDNVVLQTIFTFGSSSTARDIYDCIPYEERVGYHLRMGQFYESFLAQGADDSTTATMNCQDLLPQITRHYLKTEHTEKKLKYLKALAEFYLKSNMLTDTTQNINEIINILETEKGACDILSKEDLAEIYAMKGESLAKRMRIEEAESALMVSLQQYGIFWPTTKRQWKTELWKKKLNFLFHYHRGALPIRHGRYNHESVADAYDYQRTVSPFDEELAFSPPSPTSPKSKLDLKTQVRLQRIIRVFSCLQNIFFWKTHPDAALLSSYYTLYFSRLLGIPSGDQTASLGRVAILLYFQGKKRKCEAYMNEALRANKAGQTTDGMLPAMQAFVKYAEGHRDEAHQLLNIAINESKTFGVVSSLASFYRAVTTKCAYRMWEGAFSTHPEDCQLLRTLSAVAIQNGDTEGEALFAIPTLANLLIQDRYHDAESWVVLIEKHIMPKATQTNHLMVNAMLAFYYIKTGNFAKSKIYLQLWTERIQEQGYGAHPFPLMSCQFVIMAIYDLNETVRHQVRRGSISPESNTHSQNNFSIISKTSTLSSVPPGSPVEADPLNPTMLDKILVHAIQYLKVEPYQALASALTWLAEAERCFLLPNKEKEGFQKLAQGYREVSARIEGVTFVHAYYLTQLGRHAECELKDGYYKKAHRLFLTMSMDPQIWLTDPTSKFIPPTVVKCLSSKNMNGLPRAAFAFASCYSIFYDDSGQEETYLSYVLPRYFSVLTFAVYFCVLFSTKNVARSTRNRARLTAIMAVVWVALDMHWFWTATWCRHCRRHYFLDPMQLLPTSFMVLVESLWTFRSAKHRMREEARLELMAEVQDQTAHVLIPVHDYQMESIYSPTGEGPCLAVAVPAYTRHSRHSTDLESPCPTRPIVESRAADISDPPPTYSRQG
ncbi:hypothetical protein BGZ74_003921 [Mortierella antarctica]|nr:hypothetical protein BGZ74_003921 [Mortierella antarctica]